MVFYSVCPQKLLKHGFRQPIKMRQKNIPEYPGDIHHYDHHGNPTFAGCPHLGHYQTQPVSALTFTKLAFNPIAAF